MVVCLSLNRALEEIGKASLPRIGQCWQNNTSPHAKGRQNGSTCTYTPSQWVLIFFFCFHAWTMIVYHSLPISFFKYQHLKNSQLVTWGSLHLTWVAITKVCSYIKDLFDSHLMGFSSFALFLPCYVPTFSSTSLERLFPCCGCHRFLGRRLRYTAFSGE